MVKGVRDMMSPRVIAVIVFMTLMAGCKKDSPTSAEQNTNANPPGMVGQDLRFNDLGFRCVQR